jgi:hypothetical protein
MACLLFRYLFKKLGRIWIALGEVLGKAHVDTAVFLLRENSHRQDFSFGKFSEGFHVRSPRVFRDDATRDSATSC